MERRVILVREQSEGAGEVDPIQGENNEWY